MIEFHDPRRGRAVRLREDNANAIRQYEEWGCERVDAAQAAPPVEEQPVTPADVEKQLEAETGKDFVKTGDKPLTLAESDKPAPATEPKAKAQK